jgi:kynureninase
LTEGHDQAEGSGGGRDAADLDAADPLATFRSRFVLPRTAAGRPVAYLAGNSLGAQPSTARAAVEAVIDRWATDAVDGWFAPDRPWADMERDLAGPTARIVGARPHEVTTANTLTVNLHLLMAAGYRPQGARTAILIDAPSFPSDRYAVESHLRHRGLDPARDLLVVRPRAGEATLRVDDLEAAIRDAGGRLAMTLLAGVNYATGQRLDIGRLTAAAHDVGAMAVWDLAHAAGNVPLALHDDQVDAAAWCTYKYLNSGPGALAQLFVHERHLRPGAGSMAHLAGWWGNDPATRFAMAEGFAPGTGADAWRISTPPLLSLAPIAASLAIFDEAGMAALRAKSLALTAFLAAQVEALVTDATILTPRHPEERGAQLSIRLPDARRRLDALATLGVIGDHREPDIIRLAPVPLYNTFDDCRRAAEALAATTPIGKGRR